MLFKNGKIVLNVQPHSYGLSYCSGDLRDDSYTRIEHVTNDDTTYARL